MSLINDALKRAESEKRATQSSASTPPLQPVESAPSSTSPLLLGGVFLLGLGAIGIAAALWFGGRTTQVAQTTSAPSPEPAKEGSTLPADRGAQVSTATQPSPTTQPATSAIASAPTTVTTAPTAIDTSPQQPTPKPLAPRTSTPTITKSAPTIVQPATTNTQAKPIRLQSIFYRLKNPTVIINGKTLGIGDTFDGIKVVSIQRTSVEIVQNGKYRTLTLQD